MATTDKLRIPSVYTEIQQQVKQVAPQEKMATCDIPVPYHGTMVFRSRYEGSDSARDQINPKAEKEYTAKTRPFTELQSFMARETDEIIKHGIDRRRMDCIFNALISWKTDSDILLPTRNHTGKAVRKWTLATISANLLKINRLAEQYDRDKFNIIKNWIRKLGEQVIRDYSGITQEKSNNHIYWAAWSVMVSAVLLNREEMFAWAAKIYSMAMNQIDEHGFLPNELRRKSRARLYHNYALAPLVGIAAFLKANNYDPLSTNKGALKRLVNRVVATIDNPQIFTLATGVRQAPYNMHIKGRLSWLAIYLDLDDSLSPEKYRELTGICLESLPLKSRRLGGDIGFLYLGL
jgi:poly(beta-D-mannuronate) lyase